MHLVVRTDDFKRALTRLPSRIRELCDRQLAILESDWRDPRLHTKKLRLRDEIYSFRITSSYRAQFYFSVENRIIVFDVDHRKDAYRKRRR
ncbi:hypothetical protein A3A39_01745 [Candidatus Kaiserbacteria bacterium RIFCSPLOWO2_01_FULL_54_13]|uniref:Cytotoxin n=1 Tax=Candidatus Kaiserbacteria bacterium RIFCSPLOWO2_01_FULL_54_13 TaxID=1798512 RepID=A0A1F6F1D6_9BACT|nr:MAG: hypothetical protein A3A39_01745 [Candidatus Kaiserbacteria bacterium RIFCSPLOWO2_01_FULL_54_13]